MGNTSSSSNAVFVRLDREAYECGTSVSGSVYVNVHGSAASVGAVYIKVGRSVRTDAEHAYGTPSTFVEGVEETSFTYDAARSVDGTRRIHNSEGNSAYCHGRNQFFAVTVPLQLPSKLSAQSSEAGLSQLQIPFSFHLPLGLRPSFTFNKRGIKASISYEVSAVLQADRSALNWSGRLESSTPLTVYCSAPYQMALVDEPLESSSAGDIADCCGCCLRCPVVCMGCRGCACVHGHTLCHVGVNSSHVANGGTLEPYAMVLNSSTIPVQCKMRLIRRVAVFGSNWDLGGGQVAGIASEEQAWHHTEGPIHPNDRHMHRSASTITFPHGGSHMFPPSVHGELIQCSYELQAVVSPSNGCCGTENCARLPVVVRTVDLTQPSPETPSAPSLWDPVVMQQQELNLPSDGLVAPEAPIGIHRGLTEPLLPPPVQAMPPMNAGSCRAPLV